MSSLPHSPTSSIVLNIVCKSDGKTMSMNINESENRKVKYIKNQLKQMFHPTGKFHLYYKGRHIRSRQTLRHYGITSNDKNIEIILK